MRILIYLTLFLPFLAIAQGKVGLVFEEMPNDTNRINSVSEHYAVLPAIRLLDTNHHSKNSETSTNYFSIHALADLGFRYNASAEYRAGAGVSIESGINNKWYFRACAIEGLGQSDSTFQPKSYIFDQRSSNFLYTDIRGRVSYTPNSIFNFQAGLDHNFIGEGNRSLFLSDYGKAYPFGQIRARFWRMEYSILYQFFKEETSSGWRMKNGATHHISFNAAKWLNIGIFETVVFMPKDTMLNRGYDAEYLNPVVFYRPQEYSMGSSDNVLVGASLTARIKETTLYAQFILDEFFLAEIKAKSGWWANKYGGQVGIKGRATYNGIKTFYRIEYNAIRPYTYAHLNSGQNYGNQGMTLAHPLGGNFMEILGELKGQKGKWTGKLFASYFLQGLDKDGFSYGGNIYQPYTNRPYEYGHFVGQGKGNNGLRINLYVGYCLQKATNLHVFIENQLRYDSAYDRLSYIPMLGVRSQLWNDYRNY